MARYDRIAQIDPPPRQAAYGGWLTLRDLEGREREPELGRRALLHFLAIRPVRRLLQRGLDGPQAASIDGQVEAVRQQVDQLPEEDAARERLTHYLEEVGGRSPAGLVRATLDVGTAAEAAGQLFAAEEFYRTALELAEANDIHDQRVVGLRHLGRVQRERREWTDAIDTLEEAVALARDRGEPAEWARSLEALAAVHLRSGDISRARATLDQIQEGPGASGDPVSRAVGDAGRCALELSEGNLEPALAAGWAAASALPPGDEARNRVLLNMGAAFRRLGLLPAAESCYEIVARWAAWPEHRIEALLEHAMVAAYAGDDAAFAERRETVLDSLGQADRPLQGMVHLALGRGALIVGRTDDGREHLQESVATARDIGDDEVLAQAEQLLAVLDSDATIDAPDPLPPSDDASRIAGRVATLATEPGA